MSFISTRGGACVTASQAILRGLAPDGGLYVPAVFPQMTLADIAALTKLDYRARALTILRGYLDDFNAQELADAIASAYEAAKFDDAAIAPTKKLDSNTHVLELFHGPTLAFKDMALQLLPHLTTLSAKKNGENAKWQSSSQPAATRARRHSKASRTCREHPAPSFTRPTASATCRSCK